MKIKKHNALLIVSSTLFLFFLFGTFYLIIVYTPYVFNLKIPSIVKLILLVFVFLFLVLGYTLFKVAIMRSFINENKNEYKNAFPQYIKGTFRYFMFNLFYIVVFLTPFIFLFMIVIPLLFALLSFVVEPISYYSIYTLFSSLLWQGIVLMSGIVMYLYWTNKLTLWEYTLFYKKEGDFSLLEALGYSLKKMKKKELRLSILYNLQSYGIFLILIALFLPFNTNLFNALLCLLLVLYAYFLPWIWKRHFDMIKKLENNKSAKEIK